MPASSSSSLKGRRLGYVSRIVGNGFKQYCRATFFIVSAMLKNVVQPESSATMLDNIAEISEPHNMAKLLISSILVKMMFVVLF